MRCRCLRQHILTSGNERIKVHTVLVELYCIPLFSRFGADSTARTPHGLRLLCPNTLLSYSLYSLANPKP